MSDIAKTEQELIKDLLDANEDLGDLNVIVADDKDIVNGINISLAKLGLVLVVETMDRRVSMPELPGPVFDAMKFSVMVYENVLMNRQKTDRTAETVAKDVAEALHHQTLTGYPGPILSLGTFKQTDPVALAWAADFKIGAE